MILKYFGHGSNKGQDGRKRKQGVKEGRVSRRKAGWVVFIKNRPQAAMKESTKKKRN